MSYQDAIYKFAEECIADGAINSVAGSGKTTTGVKLCELFDRMLVGGRFMAFNRHIKIELAEKARAAGIIGFDFLTYNGFGNSILSRELKIKPRLNENKDRNLLLYKIAKNDKRAFNWCGSIIRLISLFKNMCILSRGEAETRLDEICKRHDIDLAEDAYDYLFDTFEASVREHGVISYDDQKYLPIYLGLEIPKSEVLIVDEFQDTCQVEFELIMRSGSRIFAFGDPDQCIYSFKGTTPDALDLFMQKRDATGLPLSVCYRCPVSVVQEAQKYVPRIEWNPGAPDGVVESISDRDFHLLAVPGDMVLSRLTADAVATCLAFIRRGVPAYVQGREIGKSLNELIDKISPGDMDTADFVKGLLEYKIEQVDKLSKVGADTRIMNLEDRVDTLLVLAEAESTVIGIRRRIEEILLDSSGSGSGSIVCMTIHKAKGLECNGNVFLVAPEKIPHKRAQDVSEEYRLLYVAITRAKKGFYYVRSR